MSDKPFFTVYYKCDMEMRPQPPMVLGELIRKLIQQRHNHLVNQSKHPSEEEVQKRHGFVFFINGNVPQILPCNEYVDVGSEFIVIQEYDEDVKIENPYKEILKWANFYNL